MNWKRALIFGSIGAGALLYFNGRRPVGMIMAGVGVATLALEYPDKFEQLWERAPEYLSRGNQIVDAVSRMVDRYAACQQDSEYIV
jgi:S-formylglutathione hydrolase FrmB